MSYFAGFQKASEKLGRLGWALGGVALGAGVAAIQLLPTAELMRSSQRAGGLDYDFLMNFSYGPLRVLSLLTPHFFGSPADGTYQGKGAYWEDATYIGFLPLALGLLAVFAYLKCRQRADRHPAFEAVPFFALLGVGAFALALGKYTPLYDFLYRHVLTFNLFQGPARWNLLTVFALSVLAGVGALGWGRGKWTFFWCRLATAGGGGVVAMALLAPSFIPENAAMGALGAAMVALGSWLAGSAVLTLAQPDPQWERTAAWRGRWQAAALLFIALDLIWAWAGFNPTAPAAFYDPLKLDAGEMGPGGRAYWFKDYQQFVAFGDGADASDEGEQGGYFRFNDFRVARDRWRDVRRSRLPNINLLDRAPQLNNFDPLLPGDHARYLELIEAAGPENASALLKAAGVDVVYSEAGPQGWTGAPGRFTAPEPAARAWLAGEAILVDSRAALEAYLLDERWNPYETVLLEGAPGPTLAGGGGGAVEVIEDAHTALRLRVEADGPAWLALADTWYPGWEATVDGAPVEVLRANLAFRAVHVPAGAHEVVFSYHPRALPAGAVVTAAALVGVLALLAWDRRQSARG